LRPPVIAGRIRQVALRVQAAIQLALMLISALTLSGCFVLRPPCEIPAENDYYRTVALNTTIDEEPGPAGMLPLATAPPLVVDEKNPPPPWEMTLNEAVELGLQNSKVLRDLGGSVLRRPDLAQTIHDPAVQATDPRFGMEGALSAFDAQVATRLMAYKNDRAFNNLFAGGGTFFFQQDLDNFVTEVTKTTATGGSFAMRHHIDYDANNAPANLFPSYYNVNFEGEFRQPLLQGGGVDFNRIAGPRAKPGQLQGVVIARINNDVSTAEFELGLRDLISNLENAYWDLYYAYRELDAKVSARDAALSTWRNIHVNVEQGRGYSKLQEVQALEQYYRFQEEVIDALGGRVVDRTRTFNGSSGGTFRGVGGVQASERKLRLWMGLPINDGRLIRPTDAPPQAKIVFDWQSVMEETLSTRPDLRRQQAKIQRYQAELVANRNFLLPQMDLIGRYRWRGYGNDLLGPRDAADPINNAYANLATGMFQEWELGFEYSMPLGFRQGYAAVRNSQMHIARERAILEEQERQAIHDLSAAYADADRAYALMQAGYNRLSAAQEQYDRAYNAFFNLGGKVSLELVLDARIRLAEAETSYHRGRIEYAIAVKNVHFEKGSLLDYNGAGLANEAFCQGCPDAVVHRIATSVEETPINYVLAAKQKERADAAALEKAADPSEPEAPWQGRNISYEEPVLMPPTERPQMPAASKLAPNEPVHLAAPRAPLPQHTNRTTLSPAPAAEGRSAAAEAAQAAREVAAPPASLSGSRLAPAAVTIAPLKPERLPAVEP
jgi:outer membrane protein TolC